MANWVKDLKRGKDAEKAFNILYPELIELSGFKGDFALPTGEVLELKSDFYSPHKWPNFIMERWSKEDKLGGPWQSQSHHAAYFAYWFCNFDMLYLFKTDELVEKIESLIYPLGLELEERCNTSYVTKYYRIPRKELEVICQPLSILGVRNDNQSIEPPTTTKNIIIKPIIV